jgi:hypothetical protein
MPSVKHIVPFTSAQRRALQPSRRNSGSLSPVMRRVEREAVTPDGIVMTGCKSFSRPGTIEAPAPEHKQEVCLQTGEVSCTCEHFRYRLAKQNPTLSNRKTWCKHLERTLEGCARRGEIAFVNFNAEVVQQLSCAVIGALVTFDVPVVEERDVIQGEDYEAQLEAHAQASEESELERKAAQAEARRISEEEHALRHIAFCDLFLSITVRSYQA